MYMKIAGITLAALMCFYALQYVSTKIHYACIVPEEDCPPPIFLAGELVYRLIVQPPWLTFAP